MNDILIIGVSNNLHILYEVFIVYCRNLCSSSAIIA